MNISYNKLNKTNLKNEQLTEEIKAKNGQNTLLNSNDISPDRIISQLRTL